VSGVDHSPRTIDEIPTPALVVERSAFDRNLGAMAKARPGHRLRPHVKAFKSTALAKEMVAVGHANFCAATIAEIAGMASAGLDTDLLLANETLDYTRLGLLVDGGCNITVAVDSDEVLQGVVAGGVRQILIDVEVGLPRCGCDPTEAGRLAEAARAEGLEVRGVMGYEGHLMMVPDPQRREAKVADAMALLLQAHADVGGDIVSAGGTGTYAVNTWATEIQAGSYCLMDTQYGTLEVPFEQALSVLASIVSVSSKGWAVADAGLKAIGMDHGNPTWPDGELRFCSDEHATLTVEPGQLKVGDQIKLHPAHIDPTVAKHERMWVVDGEDVVDVWPIDLRHW
jgi:D-serine deaminase-like pyridoxal phosphate-dependent protein